MKISENANYGNWVPGALMKRLWVVTAALCAVTVLLISIVKKPIPAIAGAVVTAVVFFFTLYMNTCRMLFDFNVGGVMGNVHQFLVDHFPWEESRKAQGITDGSGLMAARWSYRL